MINFLNEKVIQNYFVILRFLKIVLDSYWISHLVVCKIMGNKETRSSLNELSF